jgi:hypothetical protein
MGADKQRLIVIIAYHAYSHVAVQIVQVGLEFRSKLSVLDIVNESDKTILILNSKAAALGS